VKYPDTSEKQIKRILYKKQHIKFQPHKKKRNETSIITASELTKDEDYDIQLNNKKKVVLT